MPLFYVLPPHSVSVGAAIPGAMLTAVGWLLLRIGFGLYVRQAGSYAAYGFLGGVLLFVSFLYLAALVLLVGAGVNVALER
ncbi:YhjD/YihY/BrkB family envelope integrity protein [Halobacteriales archaeon Cl-PHB]